MNWRRGVLTLTGYSAAAVAITWPLAINLGTHLGASHGRGEPYLNLWTLGWGLHAWTADPVSILDGRVFDANIFFPAAGTLAYSDHLLLQALVLAPVYAVTGDVVLCYNLLLLASIALSGAAMHVLSRAVTGSTLAAVGAGLAWACWPYRTAHLLHLQLQALYLMPLALWSLHRVVARRRWIDVCALGVTIGLQAIASASYGLMTAVMLAVASAALAITTGQWRAQRLWSRLVVAAVLALAVALPGLLPYARVRQPESVERARLEARTNSASLQSYRQVPPDNLVYGRTGILAPREPRTRPRTGVEHQLFPGLVLLALAIFGTVRNVRRDARPLVVSSLAILAAGLALSSGPEGIPPIYAALSDGVFGFQAIRTPARFAVVAFMGLALLAALGMRSIATASGTGRWMAIPIALLALEYVNAPLSFAAAPPRQTAVGQWLADERTTGAVLYLPLGRDIDNTPYMVQSLEHRRPIINGYSRQQPAFFPTLVEGLADFPSPSALATLRGLDVGFIVAPAPVAGVGNPRMPLVERARFGEDVVYQVEWTPDAIAALGDLSGPPPPVPGVAPFKAGESATYEIHWDSGPVELPAGTAKLTVLEGGPGASRWRFEVAAETVGWVSRFYPARDRYVTVADAALRPLEHSREVREGNQDLNRTYIYDRDARNIRVGESRDAALRPEALTLPLGPSDSRDALTALYYVRTLPLSRGSMVSVPVNDAGSSLQLQVSVAEPEMIDQRGRRTPAIRLEPRLMRRMERRRPLSMTLWLSNDGRRIPLRAVVDAGYGRVRAELRELNDR